MHIFIGGITLVPPTTINESIPENSSFTFPTSLDADSEFSKLYWCFVGADSNSTNACCTCGDRCSQSDWTTQPINKNTCDSCQYQCMLIVNPVSMKYNGGTFISGISYFGQNATLAIKNITVISQQHGSGKQEPNLLYYLIGSGVGIIVIILLAVSVVYKINKHHCCSKTSYHQLVTAVEQCPSPSRKQIFLFYYSYIASYVYSYIAI